jgi:glycyl-tRNA synthetase alpha subunit
MGLADELALVTKLKALQIPCNSIFDGLTTQAERMAKVRAAVKSVQDVTYSVTEERRITMADAFQRAYGCEL